MKNIIFLDIDGVLNCELFFAGRSKQCEEEISDRITKLNFYKRHICEQRMTWLNELCEETNSLVVISSSWRIGKTVEELREILNYCGANFNIIDKTPQLGFERGVEISVWLKGNCKNVIGIDHRDFNNYAIIDDDSDMLLNQGPNFFQTDNYSGLTPNICYRIKQFFNRFKS